MALDSEGALYGLPPVIGAVPHVLILGSFPSRLSLASGQYYANPKNQFWAIMQDLFGIARDLPYPDRTARLVDHRIALFDAIGSCKREGSADQQIRSPVNNDIAGILKTYPTIRLLAFNGRASEYALSGEVLPGNLAVVRLPSTSPANARITYDEKIRQWSVIRKALR